jgi:ABC-type branched-subunit amino acid transport system substrate-binding protein
MLNRRFAVFVLIAMTATVVALLAASAVTAKHQAEPFKVMALTGIHVPVADYPEFANGIAAAANQINKQNGLGGRQVQVVNCSTGSSNTVAAQCAQQAVDQHFDWVLMYGSFLTPTFPILDAGNVPYAGTSGTSPLDYKNKNEHPLIASGNLGVAIGCWAAVKATGKKRVAMIINDNPSSLISKAMCQLGTKIAGGKFLGAISTPSTGTDFSAPVLKLKSMNPDVVGLSVAQAAQIVLMKAAVQFGLDVVYGGSGFVMTEGVIKQVGAPVKYYGAAAAPVYRAKSMKPFLADLASTGSGDDQVNLQPPGGAGWLTMWMLKALSQQVKGAITKESLVAQMKKTSSLKVKGLITWTPNRKGPALFPNSPWGGVWLQKSTPSGTIVPIGEAPVDAYQILKIGKTPGMPKPPTTVK